MFGPTGKENAETLDMHHALVAIKYGFPHRCAALIKPTSPSRWTPPSKEIRP